MKPSLLLIAKNWPEPNSTAAGRRTLDLISLFQNLNYAIHVACPAEETPFQFNLASIGVTTHSIAVNDDTFDTLLLEISPNIVMFDRFVMEEQFGWRVHNKLPMALTILDTSDLHCLRIAREQAFKHNTDIDYATPTAIREVTSIVRCDLNIMISELEIEILNKEFSIPIQQLIHIPFLIDESSFVPPLPFKQRQHLIMIGGFKHEPNRDATRWLKQSIWPKLKNLLPSGTQMHVYGAYADHAINQLSNAKDNFYIKGRTEDALKTINQYRLNLAPLRFGAGQKGKILDGWLTGTPTITTHVGAEAMATQAELGYSIPENSHNFAKLCAQAYVDEQTWQDIQKRGYDILRSKFDRNTYLALLEQRLTLCLGDISKYRLKNIWYQILWQNQFRATEFMSRWISLKNAH